MSNRTCLTENSPFGSERHLHFPSRTTKKSLILIPNLERAASTDPTSFQTPGTDFFRGIKGGWEACRFPP
ncbi:hypothetical protein Hanom_Chr06g00569141 [Helianthus anomalus]